MLRYGYVPFDPDYTHPSMAGKLRHLLLRSKAGNEPIMYFCLIHCKQNLHLLIMFFEYRVLFKQEDVWTHLLQPFGKHTHFHFPPFVECTLRTEYIQVFFKKWLFLVIILCGRGMARESAHLPPMWPGFYSSSVPYGG